MRSTFEAGVVVAAPPARVIDAYWKLERWPEVAPHVTAVDLLYGDGDAQVLVMTVNTRGRIDRFKSVRVREGNTIRYLQPHPPPILRHHHGSWTFLEENGATRVVSRHVLEIEPENAARVLRELGVPFEDEPSLAAAVEQIIRNNSLQTMRALARRLEEEVGHDEPHLAAAAH
jgi:hypothetical protein